MMLMKIQLECLGSLKDYIRDMAQHIKNILTQSSLVKIPIMKFFEAAQSQNV